MYQIDQLKELAPAASRTPELGAEHAEAAGDPAVLGPLGAAPAGAGGHPAGAPGVRLLRLPAALL